MTMPLNAKIYIPGHTGLVGSAVVRYLRNQGYSNLLVKTSKELDLTEQLAVRSFFQNERPDYVFLCAAKVGGILANASYPATFIHQNLSIQTHVIHEAMQTGVKRLLFLGSSCIYPRECPQPMKEEHLLTGALEFTNRPYAIAKIAGIEMCWAYNRQYGTHFLSAMPTNLYGSGDRYDLKNSHVLPALIRKMHEAKMTEAPLVTLWGTGTPRREFLHSDDLASAAVFLMNLPDESFCSLLASSDSPPLINIGYGEDLTIQELAQVVADVVGFQGLIQWDRSKPDGTKRKLLDISLLSKLGWKPHIPLTEGLRRTYSELIHTQFADLILQTQ